MPKKKKLSAILMAYQYLNGVHYIGIGAGPDAIGVYTFVNGDWEKVPPKPDILLHQFFDNPYTEQPHLAFSMFQSEALKGNAEAMYNLGVCYLEGTGVAVNHHEAFIQFKKAAEKLNDNVASCFEYKPKLKYYLGYCYEHGIGTTINYMQAASWYQKAAADGNAEAKQRLDQFHCEQGVGAIQDFIESRERAARPSTTSDVGMYSRDNSRRIAGIFGVTPPQPDIESDQKPPIISSKLQ
jgi:TPR repeat protein